MADLIEKLKELPDSPGVYIMLDKGGNIIYVGKAKVLKNRVRQYFHHSGVKTEKVMKMVEKIEDFRYIMTKNEKDALNLEATLIKKYKPYYNILLKDDKQYPYIKVNLTEDFPSFSVTRKVKSDRNRYFGPLMAGVRYRDVLEILAICFKVKLCSVRTDGKNSRPCLNYHLGRCTAPCMGYISRGDYAARVADAVSFLQGDTRRASEILESKMNSASENEDFETALVYRDRLNMLTAMKEKVITSLGKSVDMDVMKYVSDDSYGALSLIIVRGGKIVGSENYPITYRHMTEEEVYSGFIMQYYREGILVPPEVVVGGSFDENLSEVLSQRSGGRVNVLCPKQGVRAQLVDMAGKNASDYLIKSRDKEARRIAMTEGGVNALAEYLGLPYPPMRMECYDISNISGTDKVASMVVFVGGESKNSHYRRFRIKTVEGANDFASMKEVLTRRLLRIKEDEEDVSFKSRPDLIVVDGGKGQLTYAMEAREETGSDVTIVSLAKREEEVFVPGRELPVVIPKSSVALKLLQRIRDEAHRFAITYHRQLRGSHMLDSELDQIPGVGKKRRSALLKRFKSVAGIRRADIQEIAAVDGIGAALAEKIKEKL